jgi:hypothetical protein
MKERMQPNPEKLSMRKKVVEHPFGTMKRAFNQGYLLLRGLAKVSVNASAVPDLVPVFEKLLDQWRIVSIVTDGAVHRDSSHVAAHPERF